VAIRFPSLAGLLRGSGLLSDRAGALLALEGNQPPLEGAVRR